MFQVHSVSFSFEFMPLFLLTFLSSFFFGVHLRAECPSVLPMGKGTFDGVSFQMPHFVHLSWRYLRAECPSVPTSVHFTSIATHNDRMRAKHPGELGEAQFLISRVGQGAGTAPLCLGEVDESFQFLTEKSQPKLLRFKHIHHKKKIPGFQE